MSKNNEDVLMKRLMDKLDSLDMKVDKLDDRLDSVDKTLVKQQESLGYHIKRTDLAEENLELLRKELKPVEKHVANVEGGLKFIGILVMLSTLATALLKVFGGF